jgi:sulfur carrier protein
MNVSLFCPKADYIPRRCGGFALAHRRGGYDAAAMGSYRIELNGEPRDCADGLTLAALIEELRLGGQRVAVERNGEIVPRSRYAEVRLAAGDRIEVVRAIGGG